VTSDLRCPQCAAVVRDGADWCARCLADLRPAPAAPVAPPPYVPATAAAQIDPLTAPLDAVLASGSPAPTPPAEQPAGPRGDLAAAAEDPDLMFALLRAETRDPVLGKLEGRFSTPGARAAVMVGGGVLLAATFFVLLAVAGALFG
jgi:hypothetical protein